MTKHINIAILGLALVCAPAHAAPFGFGPGRTVVAPTVVHGVTDDEGNAVSETAPPISDPLEGINRGVYGFNKGVDNVVLKPVATVYKTVVPSFARQGINNRWPTCTLLWTS